MSSIFQNEYMLYFLTLMVSLVISIVCTPILRNIAIRFNIYDIPHSHIKTHDAPTPYLGGLAIWIGWIVSLLVIRLFTDFPTGTLHSLRGIIYGSLLLVIVGMIDDVTPRGLNFQTKFLVQVLAALLVIIFDIRIHFISPNFIAIFLTILWIVGITNAFNIIDIMDGLASGTAIIASLAFLFIALPTEHIYVNFCVAALAGALLGFIPFNFSEKRKIFMGDTGSLLIGFLLASVALGTSYTKMNYIGLFAPIIILAIPIYDTILVTILRMRRGRSPFIGSKDHFALRLEKMGFTRKKILLITYFSSLVLSLSAFLITRVEVKTAVFIFVLIIIFAVLTAYRLSRVQVDHKE